MADAFPDLANTVLQSYLDSDPATATYLGDHGRDHLLPDPSPAAATERARQLAAQLRRLADVDTADEDEDVDRAILTTALSAELYDLDTVRDDEWNPMAHNPGPAVRALLARHFAPLDDRLTAARQRVRAIPGYLEAARERLAEMSAVHLDTALDQLAGTRRLITDPRIADPAAIDALDEHCAWLADQRDRANRDPRLGPELFTRKLALTLDTPLDPAVLLQHAVDDLDRVSERISEVAASLGGRPADVLDRLAGERPTNETILPLCRDALRDTTDFVRTRELVTVLDEPIEVVEMPEIDRGVSTAYCRPAGPLETAPLPTEFAVSPTPVAWNADQVTSFYREMNVHMVRNLTVHEAMPGHALQLAHSNRYPGSTPVRRVWWSGSFVEGWAVYAEELMARSGYGGPELEMQQLKMQLRTILNTVLDIRFHCEDLTEDEAIRLMRVRGFQEHSEAAGKWRRVQLTSTQLCTYYVGYREVHDLLDDLRRDRPGATSRQLHDTVLGAGSPPVRHLRALLGLPAA